MLSFNEQNADGKSSFTAKIKKSLLCLLLVAAMVMSFSAMSAHVCYAVSVGTAADKEDAGAPVSNIDGSIQRLDGDDSTLTDQDKVTVTFRDESTSSGKMRPNILSRLNGVDECWYLTVDGIAIARASTKEELVSVLYSVAEPYISDEISSAGFLQDVAISYGLVSDSLESDMDALYQELLPGGNCSLDVRAVIASFDYADVAFETVSVEDDNYYPFQSGAVITSGEDGVSMTTTETVFINGVHVSNITCMETVKEPVSEVIAIGTREYSYDSCGEFIWPASGIITSYFGNRDAGVGSTNHKGIDIAGSYGQDIRAADSGTVIYADWMNGYGYLVQIQHDNGDVTYYGHCSELNVSVGDRVYQGQVISQMGATGIATGVHVHFEVRQGGKVQIDPISVLP